MEAPKPRRVIALSQATRYGDAYAWFVLVSTLDLLLTCVVLSLGGREVNAIARFVLERWSLAGMTGYKFTLVILVVCLCEVIGHYEPRTGRRLAWFGVAVTSVPVLVAYAHLAAFPLLA